MKKLQLSLFAVAMFMYMGADAQYVRVGFGYHGGSVSTTEGMETVVTSTSSSQKAVNLSSGKGIPVTAAFGMDIMDNVGFEFGLNYLLGSDQTAADVDFQPTSTTTMVTTKSTQLRLTPALVLHTDNDGMNMYSRFGVILPVMGKTTITNEEKNSAGTTKSVIESSGNASLGWTGAFGVTFEAGDALQIFAELEGINLAILGKSQELVEYSNPAGTSIDDLPESAKMTNFVEELTESSNYEGSPNFDPAKATEALARKSSFSSFGINIGVIIPLGN